MSVARQGAHATHSCEQPLEGWLGIVSMHCALLWMVFKLLLLSQRVLLGSMQESHKLHHSKTEAKNSHKRGRVPEEFWKGFCIFSWIPGTSINKFLLILVVLVGL